MRVLITGSQGFLGKNIVVRLEELSGYEILRFDRNTPFDELAGLVRKADAIFHLAGINRPDNDAEFAQGNTDLTKALCEAIKASERRIPLLVTSSTQAEQDNPYGKSKRGAEEAVIALAEKTNNPVIIYRLPGVFGKWCKPNYNSVVATFCHNVAQNLPLQVNAPDAALTLVYIDDVATQFIEAIQSPDTNVTWGAVQPEYTITLGALAKQIETFKESRQTLISEPVGTGLTRALYSTYMSYLSPEDFAYDLVEHADERGVFVEMLKTPDCGQFSFFTAEPNVTRGGHYHHSKTEKFLVISGQARFKFRHVVTNESYELLTSGQKSQIVETVPGWTHDITNIGSETLIVMLWANEMFDTERPDTIGCKV